jgi:hypothetical protein
MPIPEFNDSGNLPAGEHHANLQEVEAKLVFNERRQELFKGMQRTFEPLKIVGCQRIFIGGSFVTNKEFPGDFDICWQDDTVDFLKLQSLDPVLLDFKNRRAAQKEKYGGELFPASFIADGYRTYLEFFQIDRNSEIKGIVSINLFE